MPYAFQRWIPFNPLRFREEIQGIEFSIIRLESLLKQYGSGIGVKESEVLSKGTREESSYLKNIWQELEHKLEEVEKAEIPYYFIREQTKRKINCLLEEVAKLTMDKGS